MAYNIKSTVTFTEPRGRSPNWGLGGEGGIVLSPLLMQLTDSEKTTGKFFLVDDFTGYRLFSDRESAETWQAALSQCIIDIGKRTDFTTSIDEI